MLMAILLITRYCLSCLLYTSFRREEWQMNGREGWTTKCFKFLSLDDVRDGKFSTPKDKPLKNKEPAAPVFQPVEDEDDGFMPF